MGRRTYEKAKAVVDAAQAEPDKYGDLVEAMDRTGKVDVAYKALRAARVAQERQVLAGRARALPSSERWRVTVADMRTYTTDHRFDFIITDPPYPREYLDLYGILARRALEWLKPDGLLLAMCGQSYLDQIASVMCEHLTYYWAGAYMTPGQPTPLRARQVNTSWKPVLIFALPGATYKGKVFGDVWTSAGNDKQHHKWGQSESGMLAMIQQVCLPGQSIMDPFCGAGTTGVAALLHGCTFAGIDTDAETVGIARARLADVTP